MPDSIFPALTRCIATLIVDLRILITAPGRPIGPSKEPWESTTQVSRRHDYAEQNREHADDLACRAMSPDKLLTASALSPSSGQHLVSVPHPRRR